MFRKTIGWILLFCILLSAVPASALTTIRPDYFKTTLSWIGNTYSGRDKRYVPHDIKAMYVTPEGDIFTNVYWEENGNNFSQFDKDGNFVKAGLNSHGWGYEGGYAVAANSNYVYFAQNINNENGGLQYNPDVHPTSSERWPPVGYHWFGVARRQRSDITKGAPFETGMGYLDDSEQANSFLVVCEELALMRDSNWNITQQGLDSNENVISGLYATDSELYVSDKFNDRIVIYNAETMAYLREYKIEDPSHLTMDQSGVLWILQEGAKKVLPMNTADGTILTDKIIDLGSAVPTYIAIDNQNRLMVTDISENERILLYGNLAATPSVVGYHGVEGGVYSGVRGEIGNEKFYQMSAVGADASGNYYVNNAGPYTGDAGGTTCLESYTENGDFRFRLTGLEFMDNGKLDPEDTDVFYTKHEKFVLDRTEPSGQQAAYTAVTIDPHRYPDDPRLHLGSVATMDVCYVDGNKYMLVTDFYGYSLSIYRFDEETDGEIAIPCALLYAGYNNQSYPPNRDYSRNQAYIWIDQDGDGQFDQNEYSYSNPSKRYDFFGYGWTLAEDGTLYCGGTMNNQDNRILTFPLQNITAKGVPVWGFNQYTEERAPAPFDSNDNSSVRRMQYDSAEDVMYIAGYKARPTGNVDPRDRDLGDTFIRVENWSEGNRTASYTRDIERRDYLYQGGYASTPMGFSLAGDYLFVMDATFVASGKIYIYDKNTGNITDTIQYDQGSDYHDIGYMDIPYAVTASYRGNGKYDIFVEDDARAKILHYTWESTGLTPPLYAVEAEEINGGNKTYGNYFYSQYAPSALEGLGAGNTFRFVGKELNNADRITVCARYGGQVAISFNDGSGEEQVAVITLDSAVGDYRTVSADLPAAYTGIYDIKVEVLSGNPAISWLQFPQRKNPTERIDVSKPICVGGDLGVRDDGPADHPSCMGWIRKGTFLKYDCYYFEKPTELSMCIRGRSGQIGVYLDTDQSDPIAIIDHSETNEWTTYTIPISTEIYGTHDIIVECPTPDTEMMVAWFNFTEAEETGMAMEVKDTSRLWEKGEVSVNFYCYSDVPDNQPITLFFAAFDQDGNFVEAVPVREMTASDIPGRMTTCTGTFDAENLPEDCSIKAFAWNSFGKMEPLLMPLHISVPAK